jgi:hypothetical protein
MYSKKQFISHLTDCCQQVSALPGIGTDSLKISLNGNLETIINDLFMVPTSVRGCVLGPDAVAVCFG